MEWMDKARRAGGLIWVVAGVAGQIAWAASGHSLPGLVTLVLVVLVGILAVVTAARAPSAVVFVAGWLVAVALAVDFAGAVADRFGLFGGPGAPGVSWGSWDAFVAYTTTLLPWSSTVAAETVAIAATAIEIALAVLLLSGWERRWVGKATAGLLTVYLFAMLATLGPDSVARYGVPILIGGALLVSAEPSGKVRRPILRGT